jgi:hypothetical protein
MFGGSTSLVKEKTDSFAPSILGPAAQSANTEDSISGREKRNSPPSSSFGKTSDERGPAADKKGAAAP